MRWLVVGLGVSASLAFIVVSALVNYQFGITLADDETNKRIYGAVSVASDGLKAGAPFFLAAAWAARRYLVAGAALAAWALFTCYSLVSAFGFASLNRAETTGEQTAIVATYEAAVAEQERVRGALETIGAQRPAGAVEGDILAAEQHPRWTSTSGCTDATVPESRAFCTGYAELQAELATARRAAGLEVELVAANAEVRRLTAAGGVRQVDPQSEALALLTGYEVAEIRNYIGSLFTLLIEFGSGLGLFLSLQYLRYDRATAPIKPVVQAPSSAVQRASIIGDVEQFCVAMVEPSEGSTVGMTAFFRAYEEWCDRNNYQPLAVASFEVAMFGICDRVGITRNGRQFIDVSIADNASIIIEGEAAHLRLVDGKA